MYMWDLTQLYPMSLKILEDVIFLLSQAWDVFSGHSQITKCFLPPSLNVQVVIHLPGLTVSSESDFLCFSS